VVETGGLENRLARKGYGGSNPSPSAIQSMPRRHRRDGRLYDSAWCRTYRSPSFSPGSIAAIFTTPWIACGPKWVVAGPVNTIVMFAFGTE
jgi:hypothetical protein